MKIALICPSNMLYMPYIRNYEKILKTYKVDYEIINWDRFHIENTNSYLKYRDLKIGHQRNYFDYCKFNKFVVEKLEVTNYDKLIVFGIQLSYFLKGILTKKYKGKYVIDIRDYNKIIKFFNFKKIIDNSQFTVISSSAYKEWLPKCNKYIINHNSSLDSLSDLHKANIDFESKKINVAFIGATRDFEINIDFINSIKNNKYINIYFYGEGIINNNINKYLKSNNITNVFLTGRYKKEDEEGLYGKSNLINVLRYNDGINNKTALPNRLYNSAFYGKPMIAYEGTYLAKLIKKYKLGVVYKTFDGIGENIINYLRKFNLDEFEGGRVSFFEKVIRDNEYFVIELIKFTKT